jgi:exosortase B
MSGAVSSATSAPTARQAQATWFVAIAGFIGLFAPVYWSAATGLWQNDDHAHGPIILAVVIWLFWTLRNSLVALPSATSPVSGWLLFGLGLLVYLAGRVVGISIFEMAAQPLIVAGLLLLLKGTRGLRVAWFPTFYLIFMIPLPGIFVDAVTGPLKSWISLIVVEVLHWAGYPIARNGVTLTVGQYQMLVADACSGLHSMFSLTALGTLFMFIMARKRWPHNAVMLASILPIAFCANIARVMILVLVTYHLGDEAGQGFLHGTAGMVLMLVALMCFFALDSLLSKLMSRPLIAGSAAP